MIALLTQTPWRSNRIIHRYPTPTFHLASRSFFRQIIRRFTCVRVLDSYVTESCSVLSDDAHENDP